jgi:4-carboxymuconolactone decarboxylase
MPPQDTTAAPQDDPVFHRGAEALARLSPEGAVPPWESLADLAPTLGNQVAYAFGHVLSREELDVRTRELVTVAILAAAGDTANQIAFHVQGALRAGATVAEVVETITQVSVYAGIPRALNAIAAARPALDPATTPV